MGSFDPQYSVRLNAPEFFWAVWKALQKMGNQVWIQELGNVTELIVF